MIKKLIIIGDYLMKKYIKTILVEKYDDNYENFEIDNDPTKGFSFNINNRKIRELCYYNFNDLWISWLY